MRQHKRTGRGVFPIAYRSSTDSVNSDKTTNCHTEVVRMKSVTTRRRIRAVLTGALILSVAVLLTGAGSQEEDVWTDQLIVGQQAGVRLDVNVAPFAERWTDSFLGLGVGTDLHLFGGDLVIHAFPAVTSYCSYEDVLPRGATIPLLVYEEEMDDLRPICYVITAYVEGNEYLIWRNAVYAELNQDDEWWIELEWSVDPLLANLTSFDVPVGYRVYRRFVPEDVIGVVCNEDFEDLVLIEDFPVELGMSTIVFADQGTFRQKDEGRPGIAPPGQVVVNDPLGNLSVAGNAHFAGNVGIGGAPVHAANLNIVDNSGASIRLDATPSPGSTTTAGKTWTIQSTQNGSLTITDSAALGIFCTGGNPRFEIDSSGRVGLGVSPVGGAAGSLEVAHSLGVGMASPASCGDAAFAGTLNAGAATIAFDLTVGGDLDVTNLLVMNDADILNNLFVVGDADVFNLNVAGNQDVAGDLVVAGNLDVTGNLDVDGAKFFVQEHPTDPTKEIAYAALEGPEAGTYVRGTARLTDGEAVIDLPESFALVTAKGGLTVQVTLLEACNGLYVAEKTTERIVIRELMDGTSDAEFDYLVQGVRVGYEDYDPIRRTGEDE